MSARRTGYRSRTSHELTPMDATRTRYALRMRRGFTLMEMGVCLVIMSVAAAVVAPAIARLGEGKPENSGDKLVALLKQARNYAIEHNYAVTVRIDPATSHYRVDTTGTNGMGVMLDSTLDMSASETLETPLERLEFSFRPSGSVIGDSVIVQSVGASAVLLLNPWTGEPSLVAR